MRRARFDNLENPALFDAQQIGGLRDCSTSVLPHSAQAVCLSDGDLANDESPFGDSQFFKISFDFHIAFYRK